MTRNPYYRGPPSDHFDGIRFHNRDEESTDRTTGELLRWRLAGNRAAWDPVHAVAQAIPAERVAGLRITMVGHATLLIQVDGLNILTDPVWSDRASPVSFAGPRRATVPGIAFDKLPPIDAILLSHNHYDHLDIATLKRLHAHSAPLIVTPLGNDATMRQHLVGARLSVGDWGDRFDLGHGVEVAIVPANHWSARGVSDRRMALWGGFVLRAPSGSVYFAGDTAYGTGRIFLEMRENFGKPDVALVPIGGYAPRWFMSAQHCNPEEAVKIALDLGASWLIGIHWGTFNLTDEPREEPARLLAEAAARSGLNVQQVVAAVPGQCWEL